MSDIRAMIRGMLDVTCLTPSFRHRFTTAVRPRLMASRMAFSSKPSKDSSDGPVRGWIENELGLIVLAKLMPAAPLWWAICLMIYRHEYCVHHLLVASYLFEMSAFWWYLCKYSSMICLLHVCFLPLSRPEMEHPWQFADSIRTAPLVQEHVW